MSDEGYLNKVKPTQLLLMMLYGVGSYVQTIDDVVGNDNSNPKSSEAMRSMS